MGFADWSISVQIPIIYLNICLSIPSMALYIAQIVTIVRHKKFHNSFYALFVMRAIPDLLYVLNSFYGQRLPSIIGAVLYPIYSKFTNWMFAMPFFLTVHTFQANNLVAAFILLNRLTAIIMAIKHEKCAPFVLNMCKLWRKLLPLITIFVLCVPILTCFLSSLPFEARKKFSARRLELADVEFRRKNFEGELDEFVRDYIKMDGVFMLRMLTIHAGILVCTEVVDSMWEDFITSRAKVPNSSIASPQKPLISVPHPIPEDGDVPAATASDTLFRRKTSVLIPLLSAQPEGMPPSGFLFKNTMLQQSPLQHRRNLNLHQNMPKHSATYTAATGATLAVATRQLLMPRMGNRNDFLLKTPKPERYHSEQRQLLRTASDKWSTTPTQDIVSTPTGSGLSSTKHCTKTKCRQPTVTNRGRRTTTTSSSQGLPLWSAVVGSALAPFRNRSNSASEEPSTIPEIPSSKASIVDLEEGSSALTHKSAKELSKV